MARLVSVSLPPAGAWLSCTPLPALGLHLRPKEFVTGAKFRLGLPMFSSAGPCPACLAPSDIVSNHALYCALGGRGSSDTTRCKTPSKAQLWSPALPPSGRGSPFCPVLHGGLALQHQTLFSQNIWFDAFYSHKHPHNEPYKWIFDFVFLSDSSMTLLR